MAFVNEEQPLAKAPGKIGLELRNARFVHWCMRLRPRREAVDLARVARRRDHQRAFARHAGGARVPPVDRALAKLDNALRRAFALAERGQHSARKPRRVAAELGRPLKKRDVRAALGERERRRQTDDASADDENPAHRCRVSFGVEAQSLWSPSPYRTGVAISSSTLTSSRQATLTLT